MTLYEELSTMSWINNAFRIYSIADAGIKIYQAFSKENSSALDKVAAVVQGIFAGAQIGDLVVRNISSISNQAKFGMSVAVGLADGARFGTQTYANVKNKGKNWTKNDTVSVVFEGAALAFFRAGDILDVGERLANCDQNKALCKKIGDLAKVLENVGFGGGLGIGIYAKCTLVYNRYLQAQLTNVQQGNASAANSASVAMEQEQVKKDAEAAPALSDEDINSQILLLLNYSAGMNELPSIPQIIEKDRAFRHFCRITNKPIRSILIPNIPSDPKLPYNQQRAIRDKIFYERKSIEKWIKDNPNVPPPGWPVDVLPVPIKAVNLVRDIKSQAHVDNVLAEIIHRLQGIYIEEAAKAQK